MFVSAMPWWYIKYGLEPGVTVATKSPEAMVALSIRTPMSTLSKSGCAASA